MLCFIFQDQRIIILLPTQQMNRRNWTGDEDEALINAVKAIGNEDWTKISNYLCKSCEMANTARRTGKQCRERWFNHLDPSISKEPWTEEQETILFKTHKIEGNKWKEISKYLPGRTDNDIKNRFYSTLRRSLRRLNKYIGQKNSTSHMREIKPSVLTIIINFIYENSNAHDDEVLKSLKELPELIFKFSSFKPVKTNMNDRINTELKDKINIILGLVDQFNQLYGDRKSGSKKAQENSSSLKKQEQSESDENKEKIKQIVKSKKMYTNKTKFQGMFNPQQSNEMKIEEDIVCQPMLNAFDENSNESFLPIEEPSLSVNENFMGLIVIGKHIEPIQLKQEDHYALESANVDQILYEHHDE